MPEVDFYFYLYVVPRRRAGQPKLISHCGQATPVLHHRGQSEKAAWQQRGKKSRAVVHPDHAGCSASVMTCQHLAT